MWHRTALLNLLAALIASGAVALALCEAGHWLVHRPMFQLRTVRVEPEAGTLRHVNAVTLRAVALPHIRGNFFTVNLESVRLAFEGVAWVRHARVRREWPNRLRVYIEEHRALADWNDEQLVDTYGDVFAANLAEADADGALPHFYGPDGTSREVAQHYLDFVDEFKPLGVAPVEVTLSPRYAWSVHVQDSADVGFDVDLGRETDRAATARRVQRLVAAYPSLTEKWPHLTRVDLRYPDGFAVRAEGLHLADESVAAPRRAPGAAPRPPAGPAALAHRAPAGAPHRLT